MKLLSLTIVTLSIICAPHMARANENDPFAFKVVKDGDLELSCQQLNAEAALMNEIIQTTEDIKSDAKFNGHAAAAAAGIGSFLVGTVTGGIGFAVAGFAASQSIEGKEQSAEDIQDIAHQRRALMVGIHSAKNCEEPIESIMIEAERKSVIQAGSEKFANLEPASGDEQEAYND